MVAESAQKFVFLYEEETEQEETIASGEYPSPRLAASQAIVSHANVTGTTPFRYTCTEPTEFLEAFCRIKLVASGCENFVAAIRVNEADIIHNYAMIDGEFRLHGGLWLRNNDVVTFEIRCQNNTASAKNLTVEYAAIGAARINYIPATALHELE